MTSAYEALAIDQDLASLRRGPSDGEQNHQITENRDPFEMGAAPSRLFRTFDLASAAYSTHRPSQCSTGFIATTFGIGAAFFAGAWAGINGFLTSGSDYLTRLVRAQANISQVVTSRALDEVKNGVRLTDSGDHIDVSDSDGCVVAEWSLGLDLPKIRYRLDRHEIRRIGIPGAITIFQKLDGFVTRNRSVLAEMQKELGKRGDLQLDPGRNGDKIRIDFKGRNDDGLERPRLFHIARVRNDYTIIGFNLLLQAAILGAEEIHLREELKRAYDKVKLFSRFDPGDGNLIRLQFDHDGVKLCIDWGDEFSTVVSWTNEQILDPSENLAQRVHHAAYILFTLNRDLKVLRALRRRDDGKFFALKVKVELPREILDGPFDSSQATIVRKKTRLVLYYLSSWQESGISEVGYYEFSYDPDKAIGIDKPSALDLPSIYGNPDRCYSIREVEFLRAVSLTSRGWEARTTGGEYTIINRELGALFEAYYNVGRSEDVLNRCLGYGFTVADFLKKIGPEVHLEHTASGWAVVGVSAVANKEIVGPYSALADLIASALKPLAKAYRIASDRGWKISIATVPVGPVTAYGGCQGSQEEFKLERDGHVVTANKMSDFLTLFGTT